MKNPDTNPGEFRALGYGETIPAGSVYYSNKYDEWRYTDAIGKKQGCHHPENQYYAPKCSAGTTTERHNMSLQAVTIMHTPKAVAGQVDPTEEILVPSVEVAAPDRDGAIARVAAENAEAILGVIKTSNLRVVHRTLG